jgi:hypothetical protein
MSRISWRSTSRTLQRSSVRCTCCLLRSNSGGIHITINNTVLQRMCSPIPRAGATAQLAHAGDHERSGELRPRLLLHRPAGGTPAQGDERAEVRQVRDSQAYVRHKTLTQLLRIPPACPRRPLPAAAAPARSCLACRGPCAAAGSCTMAWARCESGGKSGVTHTPTPAR